MLEEILPTPTRAKTSKYFKISLMTNLEIFDKVYQIYYKGFEIFTLSTLITVITLLFLPIIPIIYTPIHNPVGPMITLHSLLLLQLSVYRGRSLSG